MRDPIGRVGGDATRKGGSDERSAGRVGHRDWGLVFGLALHLVAVWLRDHGPSCDGWSLRGNGAIVLLILYPVAVLVGWGHDARRRSWLAVAVLPVAMFLRLFVVLGGMGRRGAGRRLPGRRDGGAGTWMARRASD